MVRHLQYLDDEGNHFNCAFTSEFIEISRENCIKGHAYLLTLKTAVCIYDINGRLTDYYQELFDTDESVHVWLRKVYKKRKSMIGKIKRPETKNLHLETNTSIEQSKVIDEINKLYKEIALLGIKLPFIGNIGFVRNEIVDKISAVIGAQLKKGERLVSPWFSVHGVPHYKFTPEYITHNNVGFRMSLSRLNMNIAALCETIKTCIKYKKVNIEKSNKALEKLALVNTTLNDTSNKTDKTKSPLKDISDKNTLAFDQEYFDGLRLLT
jgi:hypothetical protein